MIDVIFVAGMIALLSMIALPRLLLAQQSAGAASAIGSLRAINSGQLVYALTCAAGFYAPRLTVLGQPPPGSRDPFVSERWVRRRAKGLPHVTALTIEGAAHAINFSHPEQLANVVRRWMADQPIVDDPTLPGRARVFLLPAQG